MKYKISFEVESERDEEMIKSFLVYSLRAFNLKKDEIKVEAGNENK